MKLYNVPVRTCIGCRTRRPAFEMIRMKVLEKSLIVVDEKIHLGGRGCYICPSRECAHKALKKARLEKALRTEIQIIPPVESVLGCQRKKGVSG
ncbi:MAG: YlxR family protein [Desulfomonilaceae bacterium]